MQCTPFGRSACACVLALFAAIAPAVAQETVCARVKIEIKQELTLERQAFDAEMKIHNTTDTGVIENVSVVVKVTDEAGTPIAVTDDPNDLSAKFFLRLASRQNIRAVDGTGVVSPKTTSVINWLLIPAPGSAGVGPLGKKYLVGATLRYRFGGEDTVLDVAPDVITVKPLPLLSLDYFLTQDVWADDPLTPAIEPAEPFTLGVRVRNNGFATARRLKIDSAQPKIVANDQGLLVNFILSGSYVNDAPVQNTLLIDFGDLAPQTSKMGRWVMETKLAGKFTEFTAKFSHADELGGALTSILQATNAHFLIRDVRVDLPGRDPVRDFLARDGDVIRVYESDGMDTLVTDRSGVATLAVRSGADENANYRLTFPATDGFVHVRLPDPYNGTKTLGRTVRSDAKELLSENVWLSKTRNAQTKQWEYWVNFFDVNSTGVYDSGFQAPPPAARAPVVRQVLDHVTQETKQLSFLVEASSPDGKAVVLAAGPLPAGAVFTQQAVDPSAPGVARAVFDWTPARGTAGNYLVTYTANDGVLSAARSANITVQAIAPPPGPETPTIGSPLSGAQLAELRPTLAVMTSTNPQDPTTKVQFEVYSDEARTQRVASALVDKVPAGAGPVARPTTWRLPVDLNDNTHYWWRARGFEGTLYSAWVHGRFFVNLFNDAPDSFNLTTPAPNAEVGSSNPRLAWTNSADKDGDAITYSVAVYKDEGLTDVFSQASDIPQNPGGSTDWEVTPALTNHVKYFWRVLAKDALGARTSSSARWFTVNTGNTAPSAPVLLSPPLGGQSTASATALVIQNSVDAENDLITYVFEIDTVNTFDSSDKKSSGQVIQGSSGSSWTVTDLLENRRYWWRVKAQDGRAESAWTAGHFLMNALNEAPPTPTVKNPGNGAWTASQQPSLEVNPVVDPEGDPVHYGFEVFRDAAMTQQVAQGSSDNTAFIVPAVLADRTTHWWRVRALDGQGLASAWSPAAVLHVSSAPYQDPSIAVTAPATPVIPDSVETASGVKKQVTIRWEGADPNIEPTVALYYGTSKEGFTGHLIVDGLRQAAGAQTGSYLWDVSSLAPGAYYVHAVIYDAKGMGRAYAPGMVVVSPVQQAGSIEVIAPRLLHTSEIGASSSFSVRLGRAPVADVVVPLSSSNRNAGDVSPSRLTFTPRNWFTRQTVTVTGRNDCVPNGSRSYQVLSGAVQSVDPDFIGLFGRPVNVVNMGDLDLPNSTNHPKLHICGVSLVRERKVNARTWEYVLKAELTNTGAALGGVVATLRPMPWNIQLLDAELTFGAVGEGETVKTRDTVVLRSRFPIPPTVFKFGIGLGFGAWFRWNVVTQP
ncbi:fibronectin type III domain-containing protein [Verminephrobacter aporrectodeae]|uniref:hypothetical protein n=1 Tax=Verminephrobacter aporrectodeae TaxID=1110389 RepID=UPI00223702EA|nr:hypothetical protein [Verminephrobacter aporrectodeae]